MSNKKTTEPTVDSELNDLLDSALNDFERGTPKAETKNEEIPSGQEESPIEAISSNDQWTEDFVKQAANQFEKNLQAVFQNGTNSEMGTSFQKMAQTVAGALTKGEGLDTEAASVDFQNAIAQALKDLSTTTENLQTAAPTLCEADFAAMFGQTSLEEGASDILPFMQGMMQSLLSKEVLYPSLKDLVNKYPTWLEEKKATLPPADHERYSKQLDLMQKVCTELERENEYDAEDVRKRRFETILSLMQEMQTCGQPPDELVGEQPALFQFDPEGNPIMPSLPPGVEPPQNCSVM